MEATEQYGVDVFAIVMLVICVFTIVLLAISISYFANLTNNIPPNTGEAWGLLWTSVILALVFVGIAIYAIIRIFTYKIYVCEEGKLQLVYPTTVQSVVREPVVQPVVVEKQVIQPVMQPQPVIQPVIQPVVQQPMVQPVVQQPVVQQPVVQPVIQPVQPVVQPVVQQPIVQQPIVQQPVVQPVVQPQPVFQTQTSPTQSSGFRIQPINTRNTVYE
jgi:hypothetical protein